MNPKLNLETAIIFYAKYMATVRDLLDITAVHLWYSWTCSDSERGLRAGQHFFDDTVLEDLKYTFRK